MTSSRPVSAAAPREVEGLLQAAGFRRARTRYRRGGAAAFVAADWLVLTAPPPEGADILRGQIGRAGPWKPVSDRRGLSWRCHLPLSALEVGGCEEEGDGVALIDWVAGAAGGAVARGWSPPPRDAALFSLAAPRLTVRSGALAVQGELVHEPGRLALRFPLVRRLSPSLPAPRRARLREVLAGAQDRWRLARVGWDEEPGSGPEIAVEVDLSGAPHEGLELLLPGALDALRCVVSWLLWPVSLLADPGIECASWNSEVVPRAGAARRKELSTCRTEAMGP